MVPPKPHYMLSLGDYEGQHSWIVKSRRGLGWSNVPMALEEILQGLASTDILDFELGGHGGWYIKYEVNGVTEQKLSKELQAEIGHYAKRDIDRMSLGNPGSFWMVTNHAGQLKATFNDRNNQHSKQELESLMRESRTGCDHFKFVAFGCEGSYCFATENSWSCISRSMLDVVDREGSDLRQIMSVILSTLNEDSYVVIWQNGSYEASLPDTVLEDLTPYLSPEYSLRSDALPGLEQSAQRLRFLEDHDPVYAMIFHLMIDGWRHPHKRGPRVEAMYAIEMPNDIDRRYRHYRALLEQAGGGPLGNERLKFHGTPRLCNLGDRRHLTDPCTRLGCYLCGIIRESFSLAKAGTAPGRNFMRFGRGIYTTSVSSKADDYNGSVNFNGNKALVVAKVALGLSSVMHRTSKHLTAPPSGHHSVLGEVGVSLNYDEQVVYCDDAIRPAYLVIYKP